MGYIAIVLVLFMSILMGFVVGANLIIDFLEKQFRWGCGEPKKLIVGIAVLLISVALILGSYFFFAPQCPDCGHRGTTTYCTKCGTKMSERFVSTCDGCGAIVTHNDEYCADCGTKVAEE